jgi:formamidopyrimidine-DNA glycosylase
VPELPEVETIANGLAKRVTGEVIRAIWLGSKPEPLKSTPSEIAAALEFKRIIGVRRVGKHIVFDLRRTGAGQARKAPGGVRRKNKPMATPGPSPDAQWVVHLGMTGRLLVSDPQEEVPKHTHAILTLASGRELRFVDPRRFGRLSVAQGFKAAGSEPLEVEEERFVELFRERKTAIKSALLNQKLLSGVGNIYADESLFRAGIRPSRRANSLAKQRLRRLYLEVRQVLKEAIALGG